MKKIVFIAAFVLSLAQGLMAQTQGDTDEKATQINLPEAGNIMFAIEAKPFLEFAGNMFNGTTNNTLNFGSSTIYAKYFLSAENAVRIRLRINENDGRNYYYITDDAALASDPLSTAKITDLYTYRNHSYTLGAGYEIRKNYDRFAGFYGGELGYTYSRSKEMYTYGNPMSSVNPTPTTAFGYTNGARILNYDSGIQNNMYLNLVAGVEYYFMRHACIGGELGLGAGYNWGSQEDATFEKWTGSEVYQFNDLYSPGDYSFSVNTIRPITYGGLYLGFHF